MCIVIVGFRVHRLYRVYGDCVSVSYHVYRGR